LVEPVFAPERLPDGSEGLQSLKAVKNGLRPGGTRGTGGRHPRARTGRWGVHFCNDEVRAIEEVFALGKGEVGLNQYGVRSRVSWDRHMMPAMTAHARLALMRIQLYCL
jgi:hypothetical protein